MATALDSFFPFSGQTVSNANWQNYVKLFATDGVRLQLNTTSALKVVQRGAGANMSVDVSAGRLLLQGIFGENSTTKNLVIAAADATNPRIDVIVVRITQATPTVQLDVLTGTAAGVPVAPTLTQSAAVYEVALANIAVAAAAPSIVTANITDERAWGDANAVRVPSVASATALPYPSYTSAPPVIVQPVSGTTNITSIPIGPASTILVLEFVSAGCTVTAGGNLTLPRDYTSTATGTLSLYSDGTNWVEFARAKERQSANIVLAGPASGAAAAAAYRSLVAADGPAFTTWTVGTITQSATISPVTTNYARTNQWGKFAVVSGCFTLGSAGTGNNPIIVTLPAGLTIAASWVATHNCIGSFVYIVTASGTFWAGSVEAATATTIRFFNGAQSVAIFGQTGAAVTVANGDILSFTFSVELA